MKVPQITPAQARDRLRDAPADFVLLDCREPEELALARVPGTLDIPMGEIPARAASLDRSKEIAVLCHHGHRSLMVAEYLAKQGFPRVASVAGGIHRWARHVDPTIPVY